MALIVTTVSLFRPRRRSSARKTEKDRKSVDDKEQERKGEDSDEDDDAEGAIVKSSLSLRSRDSLILSRERLARDRVSTASCLVSTIPLIAILPFRSYRCRCR